MSQRSDLYGVEKIILINGEDNKEMEFKNIREDTAKFTLAKGELTKIFTETDRLIPYRVFSNPGEGAKVEFGLYANFSELSFLMGGQHSDTRYSPSENNADIYRTLKIYTRKTDNQGHSMVVILPYAHIQTGIEASLKHNDIGYIEVVATAMKKDAQSPPFILEIIKAKSPGVEASANAAQGKR